MIEDVISVIHARRSHKAFRPEPITREQITMLLDAAVRAPNHKLSEPWNFLVLGPQAKRAYAETRARRKFKGDPANADKAQRLIEETVAFPAVLVVTQRLDEDPVRREEDYAAVWMAIQNLLLTATSMGLGSKVNTGAIMDDPQLRGALQVPDGERIVSIVHLGAPAEELPARPRIPASEKTRWLP